MDNQNSLIIQAPDPPQAQISSSVNPRYAKRHPQQTVDHFWDIFTTKHPGRVKNILPENIYAKSKAAHEPKGVVHGQAALRSYEDTRQDCIAAVRKIAKECKRVNMRYRDPHFDIEFDLKWGKNDCLEGLVPGDGELFAPKSVKRVPEVFEKPQFIVDGATAGDVRQGNDGDCWFLSALCAISNKKGLIDKVCVEMDENVGVYGFVFHRDGEWSYTIIDDKLYLNSSDYDESNEEKLSWDQVFNRQNAEEEYRKAYQTGSRALYFAQCSTENETWVPLLEKAYAKAHGDYRAIYGGFTGEAIEDLTGGVTTELFTSDILDREKFWNEELMQVNKEFLFGCATGWFDDWNGRKYQPTDRKGIVSMHAYSIMEAVEVKGKKLLKVRNPWGKTEWQGAWSDGSREWTPEWMELLHHRFDNDGVFWISFDDLLRKYQSFDRTRLFGNEWSVTQQWTTVDVPWTADYNDTKFTITIEKKGPIVIVLSQLDDRYFRGLEGQYVFSLHFRLDKLGEHDYIVRSHGNYLMSRSVSTDLELEPGTYSVLMKITSKRYSRMPTPEVTIRENCRTRQEKLVQIGLAYDLAHARGQVEETDEERKRRIEQEEKAKAASKKRLQEEVKEKKYKDWLIRKKESERRRRQKLRCEEHKRKKADKRGVTLRSDEPGKGKNTNIVVIANTDSAVQVAISSNHEQAQEAPVPQSSPLEEPAHQKEFRTTVNLDKGPSQFVEPKDITAQARMDRFTVENFNKDLEIAKNNPTPGLASRHRHNPSSTANGDDLDEVSTVVSWCTSVISDLDYSTSDPNADKPNPEDNVDELFKEDEIDEENVDFANDPWNAVCVVGLRVYSKDKGVTVRVVRPKVGDDEEETPLDLDDPSKGISEDTVIGSAEARAAKPPEETANAATAPLKVTVQEV